MRNEALRTLEAGERIVGAWLLSGSPRAAEALSRSGIDWIGIDAEHAPNSPRDVERLVRAIEPEATAIVRLSSVESAVAGGAKLALDAGAEGIIVPDVETAADASDVVQAARFPPAGDRGVAGTTRANAYGERFDEHVSSANDETLVVVQIESRSAVRRAEDILAVDGIDVAFVGENDLSASLGDPGATEHPEVIEAVERVNAVSEANDVYPGIAARTPAALEERTEQGFRFFLLGADLSFMRAGLEKFRSR